VENLKTQTSKEQMVDSVTYKNTKIVLKTIKNRRATRPGEINAAILKYGVLILTLRFHLINTSRKRHNHRTPTSCRTYKGVSILNSGYRV